ncbi:MAG: Inward rectifier potassium channel Irk [Bacteroidota bacterium]|nr:Inward rectifier potassium channel Irk [Bacteroidota bacterium]
MSLLKSFNRRAKTENETGLGTNTSMTGGRFFNADGTPNIHVQGMKIWARLNLYHMFLSMPKWKFIFSVILFFISINLLFAGIYLFIGIDHLNGMIAHSPLEKFGEAFFFSAQTFTTVGYGRISPIGFAASFTAALEALVGLMCFALATGLLYGRFAKPRAYIKYSKNALFVPFRNGVALMFRMVPYTKNFLVNVEVKVTLALQVLEEGINKTRFFNVPLDIAKANTLVANWTLVHMINEESPLFNLSKDDIESGKAELLVFVQGFDESFSNTVISRASYLYTDFVYGAKFAAMYNPSSQGDSTVLHLDKLDDFEPSPLPENFKL